MNDLRDLAAFFRQRKNDPVTGKLTGQQQEFLIYLSHFHEPPTVLDMAREMHISPSRASFLLRTLREKGLVREIRTLQDLRSKRIGLLPEGQETCNRLEALYRGKG